MDSARADIIARLQQDILKLEGFRPAANPLIDSVLGPLQKVFPMGAFPMGAIHEFQLDRIRVSCSRAATVGFMAALASPMLSRGGVMLWLGRMRSVFPPALMKFGVKPDQVIFVDIVKAGNVLWATEEALKCAAVAVVVAEVGGLDIASSRRLQLSAEKSQTTGFLIRNDLHPGLTTSTSRWRITPMPGVRQAGLPGVGFPQWKVELLKLRNGVTGIWHLQFIKGCFHEVMTREILHDGEVTERSVFTRRAV